MTTENQFAPVEYSDLVKEFSSLALSFIADTDFEPSVIINKHGVRFELHTQGEFTPRHVAHIQPQDSFDEAYGKLVSMIDLLEFKAPEDFELKSPDLTDSMRMYYENNGTKGEL